MAPEQNPLVRSSFSFKSGSPFAQPTTITWEAPAVQPPAPAPAPGSAPPATAAAAPAAAPAPAVTAPVAAPGDTAADTLVTFASIRKLRELCPTVDMKRCKEVLRAHGCDIEKAAEHLRAVSTPAVVATAAARSSESPAS